MIHLSQKLTVSLLDGNTRYKIRDDTLHITIEHHCRVRESNSFPKEYLIS